MEHTVRTKVPREPAAQKKKAAFRPSSHRVSAVTRNMGYRPTVVRIRDVLEPESLGFVDCFQG